MSALLCSTEVGVHVAEINLCIDCVLLVFGEVQGDCSLKQSHLDVAGQAVNIYIAKVMIYNDSGVGRHLDVVFQIEVDSNRTNRRREVTIARKIGGDHYLISTALSLDVHALQFLRFLFAFAGIVLDLCGLNRSDLHIGPIPRLHCQDANRVRQSKLTAHWEVHALRVAYLNLLLCVVLLGFARGEQQTGGSESNHRNLLDLH